MLLQPMMQKLPCLTLHNGVCSVTRQELVRNGEFLIESGAAASVGQQSLADSFGRQT